MTFYAKNGLAFTLLPGAEVKVEFGSVGSVVLDCDTWASTVASMSAEGDTAEGFEIARTFHISGTKRIKYEPPTAI